MENSNSNNPSFEHQVHQYVSNSATPEAHTVETWTSATTSTSTTGYIHGGAWWRPMITSSTFSLTVKHLIASPSIPNIAGFASLNYRLSIPPPLPQFEEFAEPQNPARNVKHPAHLNDVVAGLQFLQTIYSFKDNYILVGHSCGATLAFQTPSGTGLDSPAAVLGVEGIYDLNQLRDDHVNISMYQYFTENAFGKDEEAWKKASPTSQKSEQGFVWETAKVTALAQSDEDELVNNAQWDAMWDVMKQSANSSRTDLRIQLKGKHDEIWRDANPEPQLKVAVEKVLSALVAG